MRQHADDPKVTAGRRASSPTAARSQMMSTTDSIVLLQRLAGNRAVTDLLQRQAQDPSGPARAAAQQPVLGGPASTGSFTVLTVPGRDVPASETLAYPAIPAPDREYRYANYHRVRYMTVWVLSRIGPWTPVPGDDSWQRELEWGRLRLAATETWLIQKHWFWDSNVRVQRGTIYLSSEPFATMIRHQGISPPPPAGPNWRPDQGAPLTSAQAPEASPGEAIAMQAARNASTWMFTANVVRGATGQSPVPEPGSVRMLGGLFVLQSMVRALVADNALLSSVFDNAALWVRSVPAPGSR